MDKIYMEKESDVAFKPASLLHGKYTIDPLKLCLFESSL